MRLGISPPPINRQSVRPREFPRVQGAQGSHGGTGFRPVYLDWLHGAALHRRATIACPSATGERMPRMTHGTWWLGDRAAIGGGEPSLRLGSRLVFLVLTG